MEGHHFRLRLFPLRLPGYLGVMGGLVTVPAEYFQVVLVMLAPRRIDAYCLDMVYLYGPHPALFASASCPL